MLVQDFSVVLRPGGVKRHFRVMFQRNTVLTRFKGSRRITTCILFSGYIPVGYAVAVQCPKDKLDPLAGYEVAMKKAVKIAVTNMLTDGAFTEKYKIRKWIVNQVIIKNKHVVRVADDSDLFLMISNKIFSAWKTNFVTEKRGKHAVPVAEGHETQV